MIQGTPCVKAGGGTSTLNMSQYINVVDKDSLMAAWACGQGPNKTKCIIPNVVIDYGQGEYAARDLVGYLQRISYEDGSGLSFEISMYINCTKMEDEPEMELVHGYLDLRKTKNNNTQVIVGDNNIQVSGNMTLNDSVVIRD